MTLFYHLTKKYSAVSIYAICYCKKCDKKLKIYQSERKENLFGKVRKYHGNEQLLKEVNNP